MAYTYGGYPPGYMPGYYAPGAAMPDQLAQLRAAQQMPPQMPAQQPVTPQMPPAQQPGQSPIIWVQGEAGAKSYMVAPGSSVMLMDSERSTFYIKTADASGMPSMRVFDYAERTAQPQQAQNAQQPMAEYVTRGEFEALAARIDGLTVREAPRETPRQKRAAKEDAGNGESAL